MTRMEKYKDLRNEIKKENDDIQVLQVENRILKAEVRYYKAKSDAYERVLFNERS